ncbi:MAG: hypothetical protein ACXW0S_04965 [Solirubrobacterales bacterium]
MNQDPIISGGLFKAALVILVAGALGVGAYLIAGGDAIDIDLPDLPDIDTLGDTTTNLQDTNLQDTTIGGGESAGTATDPFTSVGFASALGQVREEAGADAQLTRLFINEVQTQFIVRTGGDGVEAYSVRADSGELVREDATITISGNASIDDFAFALGAVKPAAVDRMLAAAREQSGAGDLRPTVLSLERGIPFGSRALEWTINAQGGGRNLLYRANAEGREVRNDGGEGTAIPPAAIEAQKLNDCIREAENDPERILACLERFQ